MFIHRAFQAFFRKLFLSGTTRQKAEIAEGGSPKIVICKTLDEVNIDLARRWCDEDGLTFQLPVPGERLFPAGAAAMVIDLNHLALQSRERVHFVERLAKARPPYPVAIASYDLETDAIDTLQAQGLLVFRRIERQLFYELGRAINYDVADAAVSRSFYGARFKYAYKSAIS